MLLLVQNRQGYLNLSELLARAWTRNVGQGQPVVQAGPGSRSWAKD
jgi:DNA polymerase-3 subunit alpha